jgi:peroxiredoxin
MQTQRLWMAVCFVVAPLVGCGGDAGALEGSTNDSDGDGLTNAQEAELGSNPDDADTDNDGYDDGAEVFNNTDPLNAYDHPYQGGWAIDSCRDSVDGIGNRPGEVATDFSLEDQFGDTVRLHDFCGKTVLIASAAEWCDPCREEAVLLQQLYDKHRGAGLMVITLLGETLDFGYPTRENVAAWADAYGITHPVLQDRSFSVASRYAEWQTVTLPTNTMLGKGAEVLWVDREIVTEQDVLDAL